MSPLFSIATVRLVRLHDLDTNTFGCTITQSFGVDQKYMVDGGSVLSMYSKPKMGVLGILKAHDGQPAWTWEWLRGAVEVVANQGHIYHSSFCPLPSSITHSVSWLRSCTLTIPIAHSVAAHAACLPFAQAIEATTCSSSNKTISVAGGVPLSFFLPCPFFLPFPFFWVPPWPRVPAPPETSSTGSGVKPSLKREMPCRTSGPWNIESPFSYESAGAVDDEKSNCYS